MTEGLPEAPPATDRLEAVVAILIALATVIGAVVAWRASVAEDGAGDADFAGLHAAANYQEARALSRINGYEHYSVFINFQRSRLVQDGLEEMAAAARGEKARVLDQEAKAAADMASASLGLLGDLEAARYLNRDGTYGLDREMGAMMAAAAKSQDLNFQSQFDEAEQLRDKTNRLMACIVVLSISLVFFTLVETFEGALRYVMVACGSLLLVGGGVWAFLIEMKV